ncbi:hypothetical protein ACFRMN_34300 [Streptomyces sp. NPDC056835]|uniref:golvesin C-terminal-like domain-containing protein n=1 Tax=Streptomyces sp. NPDC056835 TaxID=3345956 RepID=UPI0036C3F76F
MAVVAAGGVLTSLLQAAAWADEPRAADPPASSAAKPAPDSLPTSDRAKVLGEDYKKSADIAWTTTGDAQGFHLLTATEKSGYTWKTLASLAEPGFDADQWIGNACVTGSGKRAVVVYAPRTFTNDPKLLARGGFTAIVDLTSGAVTKLKVNASLSYYNPGCGTGEEAVLTQSPGEDKKQTRLIRVDAATGKLSKPVVTDGQVTSSVPAGGGKIAGASGRTLIEIDTQGAKKKLAATGTVPYRISKDSEGGYVFLERVQRDSLKQQETALVHRWADKKVSKLGSGPLGGTGLTRLGGHVYLTGDVKTATSLPKAVTRLAGTSKDATLSTTGAAIVQHTVWADGKGSPQYLQPEQATDARPVKITASVRDSGERAGFTVTPLKAKSPQWETSRTPSPLLGTPRSAASDDGGMRTNSGGTRALADDPGDVTGTRTEIVESERTCSVPRSDPRNQAMQPKPRQVEWAVNKAITGKLDIGATRPANWKNLGMPAYAPQTLFPNPALDGGGRVPAQVMLGITAQESNMWQAARSAVPGVTGSPLIGNYYGIDYYDGNSDNDWDVNWSEADCGYGITQVTDHMRLAGREHGKGGTAWDYQKQRAVALDYAANVAAGLQILVSKWNQTKQAGLVVHDGNPNRLENWFFALWSYNSGFYENVNGNEPWGVGWANNPANPEWDAGRTPFLEDRLGNEDASAAARPQNWPYPEKVLGFAAHPPSFIESPGKMVAAFLGAWWNGTSEDATIKGSAKYNRAGVKPPEDLFCGPYNWCEPSKISDNAQNEPGQGPCTQADFKCWFHQSVQWKTDCSYSCGNEYFRFPSPDYDAEQADGTAYPPNCSRSGLPSRAMIIDDLPGGTPSVRPSCANSDWSNAGSFSLDFGAGEAGVAHDGTTISTVWPAKVDLHQLGAGFGGHFYFGHTRQNDAKGERLKMTATWKLNQAVNGAAKVWVHLPDHGAHTKYAEYKVDTKYGTKTRVVSQPGSSNRWVPIGAFMFDAAPVVRLSTTTKDGTGDQDIAFDAIAVEPIAGRYVQDTVDAIAFFDEDQNVDTDPNSTMFFDTPFKDRQSLYDWGIDTSQAVLTLPTCVDSPAPSCVKPETKAAMGTWNTWVKESGTHPVDHPDGKSIPAWVHFSNRYQDRPGPTKPSYFDTDDSTYKIKSKVKVSYVAADDGSVIEGSEDIDYDSRTADTHLPNFVMDSFKAIQKDYGIAPPNLNYSTGDLNEHDGRTTTTDTNSTGIIPGRAYAPVGKRPEITDTKGYAASGANAKCVSAAYTSGGSIGYRPMLGVSGVDAEVNAWRARANVSGTVVPQAVRDLMSEIYNAFFKSGITGSIFNQSPPIWQELNFISCSDGTIRKRHSENAGSAILRSSFMPNQYLYRNGQSMALDGSDVSSFEPVITGDFKGFSRVATLNGDNTPYGYCDQLSGHGGNPWGIDLTDGPGVNRAGRSCFEGSSGDPDYNVG